MQIDLNGEGRCTLRYSGLFFIDVEYQESVLGHLMGDLLDIPIGLRGYAQKTPLGTVP